MTARNHEAQLAVRLPKSSLEALDALVPERHPSRADAVRAAIDHYLYRLACEDDWRRYAAQPFSDDELALADDPRAWDATPRW